jgi:hypothetical protein
MKAMERSIETAMSNVMIYQFEVYQVQTDAMVKSRRWARTQRATSFGECGPP